MKLLLDVNLAPRWVVWLSNHQIEAVHWSTCGAIDAADAITMQWALDRGHVVLTHDLDFGSVLAMTNARGPSVIQIRCPDPKPELIGITVVRVCRQFATELADGTLIVVEEQRQRARVLPLR